MSLEALIDMKVKLSSENVHLIGDLLRYHIGVQ